MATHTETILANIHKSSDANPILFPGEIPPVKMSSSEVISSDNKISGVGRTMSAILLPATITKCERYDEDIIQQMLRDTRISVSDRKRLSEYNKHARVSPSKAGVVYERAESCKDAQLGRYYPVGGKGLQSFRWDIRGPLTEKYYWDIDLENAHYNIALKYARDYGLIHTSIEKYCKNREACLKLFSDKRDEAKTAYLKLLYNGDLALYCEGTEDTSGQCKPEGLAFYRSLKEEVDRLLENIWTRHPQYHKHKCGKEKKAIEKRPNRQAVLMSLIFQTEEAKCMWVLDKALEKQGRTVGILIHDGVEVEKLGGEMSFPEEILKECAKEIEQSLGYSFTIVQKPIKNTYTAPPNCANEYAKMKVDFEKKFFLVGATLNEITSDGIRLEHKMAEARIICANWIFHQLNPKTMEMSEEPFLESWLKDKNRLSYERCDFIPSREKCPPKVFNLFTGFVVEEEMKEEVAENGEIDEKEGLEMIAPILKHLGVLCGGDSTYFQRWLANLFQAPDVKSEVGLLFRDKNTLLHEGGGTGKNLFIEWLGKAMLGEKYYTTIDDNSVLYASFNSIFEGKLLAFVEEAEGKDNHGNVDKLKSKITKKRAPIRKKMVAEYDVNDYCRWIFGTNGDNALPIRQGDRRFGMFDVDKTHRGDKGYFDALVETLENRRARVAFYQYLMALPTYKKPIEFQLNRPITSAYIDIRQMNAPAHMKWLRHELRRATLPEEATTSSLYARFSEWYRNGNRDADRIIKENAFARLMNEAFEMEGEPELGSLSLCEVRHTMVGAMRRFNFAKLIEGMEKLHLLVEGECAVDGMGCLIQMEADE